jgi:isoleucyl-tRNA synthetase
VYFDVSKDRLYTAAPNSRARRSGQTAMYRIHYALVRLLAPILTFTAEEVWGHTRLPADAPKSVHVALFPEPEELTEALPQALRGRVNNWERLIEVRDRVLKELEVKRQDKFIGAPLEARVRIAANGDLYPLLKEYAQELPGLFIVSQVEVSNADAGDMSIVVERAEGVKCERCWKYTTDVGSNKRFPTVCAACADAVTQMLG